MKSLANKKLFLLDHSDSRHHISETFTSTFMPRRSRTEMLSSTFFTMPHLWQMALPLPLLWNYVAEFCRLFMAKYRPQYICKKMWNVNFRLANEPITVTHHHNDSSSQILSTLANHHLLSGHLSTCCRQEDRYSELQKLVTLEVGWLIFGTLPSDFSLACCWFLLTNSALFILPARLAPVVLQSADGRQENFGLIN